MPSERKAKGMQEIALGVGDPGLIGVFGKIENLPPPPPRFVYPANSRRDSTNGYGPRGFTLSLSLSLRKREPRRPAHFSEARGSRATKADVSSADREIPLGRPSLLGSLDRSSVRNIDERRSTSN